MAQVCSPVYQHHTFVNTLCTAHTHTHRCLCFYNVAFDFKQNILDARVRRGGKTNNEDKKKERKKKWIAGLKTAIKKISHFSLFYYRHAYIIS